MLMTAMVTFIQHDLFSRSFSKKSGTGVVQILTLAYVTRKMPFFDGWYRCVPLNAIKLL
jgi:hypothetical protein